MTPDDLDLTITTLKAKCKHHAYSLECWHSIWHILNNEGTTVASSANLESIAYFLGGIDHTMKVLDDRGDLWSW